MGLVLVKTDTCFANILMREINDSSQANGGSASLVLKFLNRTCPKFKKSIYSAIVLDGVFDALPGMGQFELALLTDILEHFRKERGHELLGLLFEHATNIIVATPNRFLEQGPTGQNQHEEHQSGWTIADFKRYTIIEQTLIPRISKQEKVLTVYLQK